MAKALGVEAEFVKTGVAEVMDDFIEKCDFAVGGISVTLDRQKTRVLLAIPTWSTARRRSPRCENVAKVPEDRRHRQARA